MRLLLFLLLVPILITALPPTSQDVPLRRKKTRSVGVADGVSGEKQESMRMQASKTNAAPTRLLKSKLLENLNKYFGEESGALEILDSKDPQSDGSWRNLDTWAPPAPVWSAPHAQPTPNPWLSWTTPVPFVQQPVQFEATTMALLKIVPCICQKCGLELFACVLVSTETLYPVQHSLSDRPAHPTLIAPVLAPHGPVFDEKQLFPSRREGSWNRPLENKRVIREPVRSGDTISPQRPITTDARVSRIKKKRGDSLNRDTIDTIRRWRTRLYKAFKGHDAHRDPPKITRTFQDNESGDEAVEFESSPILPSQELPPATRKMRTESGEGFVTERSGYRFTAQPEIITPPPPVTYPPPAYTTPPPYRPFTIFPTLSPVPLQSQTPPQERFEPAPQLSILPTSSPTLPPMIRPPTAPQDYQDFDEASMVAPQMSGVPCISGDCAQEQEGTEANLINEDKCNSVRLKELIETNIVPHDAEASKKLVQEAAEASLGRYFDAICGTGFFSYIAHTDEFCQASVSGVNCYVFSPVCGENTPTVTNPITVAVIPFKTKQKRKANLNRN